jgi:hypothetical protein
MISSSLLVAISVVISYASVYGAKSLLRAVVGFLSDEEMEWLDDTALPRDYFALPGA